MCVCVSKVGFFFLQLDKLSITFKLSFLLDILVCKLGKFLPELLISFSCTLWLKNTHVSLYYFTKRARVKKSHLGVFQTWIGFGKRRFIRTKIVEQVVFMDLWYTLISWILKNSQRPWHLFYYYKQTFAVVIIIVESNKYWPVE